jgi:hypothetical protein
MHAHTSGAAFEQRLSPDDARRAARRTEMRWDELSSLLCERAELVQAAGLVSQQIAHFRLKTRCLRVVQCLAARARARPANAGGAYRLNGSDDESLALLSRDGQRGLR